MVVAMLVVAMLVVADSSIPVNQEYSHLISVF